MYYQIKKNNRAIYLIAIATLLVTSYSFMTGAESHRTEREPLVPEVCGEIVSAMSQTVQMQSYQSTISEPTIEDSARIYSDIPFDPELQSLLWSACKETGCPYELALSVIWCETRFQNINGDNGNSVGYMQIQPKWHQERMERLGVTDLSEPLSNFRVGCDFLAELISKYGSEEKALTCYNTGSPGTSQYATRVLNYMNETF